MIIMVLSFLFLLAIIIHKDGFQRKYQFINWTAVSPGRCQLNQLIVPWVLLDIAWKFELVVFKKLYHSSTEEII